MLTNARCSFLGLLHVCHAVLDGQLHSLQLLVFDYLLLLVFEDQLLEFVVLAAERCRLYELLSLLEQLALEIGDFLL